MCVQGLGFINIHYKKQSTKSADKMQQKKKKKRRNFGRHTEKNAFECIFDVHDVNDDDFDDDDDDDAFLRESTGWCDDQY